MRASNALRAPGTAGLRRLSSGARASPLSASGRRRALAEELGAELGRPAGRSDPLDVHQFALQCTWRMTAQWPAVPMSASTVEGTVQRVLAGGSAAAVAGPGKAARFTAALLAELRTCLDGEGGLLDLRRYDLPDDVRRTHAPPGG